MAVARKVHFRPPKWSPKISKVSFFAYAVVYSGGRRDGHWTLQNTLQGALKTIPFDISGLIMEVGIWKGAVFCVPCTVFWRAHGRSLDPPEYTTGDAKNESFDISANPAPGPSKIHYRGRKKWLLWNFIKYHNCLVENLHNPWGIWRFPTRELRYLMKFQRSHFLRPP